MARHTRTKDHQRGPVPEIYSSNGNIVYVMTPAGLADKAALVIRCDPRGELWVALAGEARDLEGE